MLQMPLKASIEVLRTSQLSYFKSEAFQVPESICIIELSRSSHVRLSDCSSVPYERCDLEINKNCNTRIRPADYNAHKPHKTVDPTVSVLE